MFFYNLIKSGASISEILIAALSFVLVVVFSIVIHEVSHGFAAKLNGDNTAKERGRLTLNPVVHFDLVGVLMFLLVGFGWAKPVPIDPSNFKKRKLGMVTVSLAGIVANLLLASIGLLALYLCAPLFSMATSVVGVVFLQLLLYILIYGIQINFMLALFNLLPIYPLDGFNLVNSFLPYGNKYAIFMRKYGFILLLGLIILGQIGDMLNFPYLNIFDMFGNAIVELIYTVIGLGA